MNFKKKLYQYMKVLLLIGVVNAETDGPTATSTVKYTKKVDAQWARDREERREVNIPGTFTNMDDLKGEVETMEGIPREYMVITQSTESGDGNIYDLTINCPRTLTNEIFFRALEFPNDQMIKTIQFQCYSPIPILNKKIQSRRSNQLPYVLFTPQGYRNIHEDTMKFLIRYMHAYTASFFQQREAWITGLRNMTPEMRTHQRNLLRARVTNVADEPSYGEIENYKRNVQQLSCWYHSRLMAEDEETRRVLRENGGEDEFEFLGNRRDEIHSLVSVMRFMNNRRPIDGRMPKDIAQRYTEVLKSAYHELTM